MKRIAMFVAPFVALALALAYAQALRAADAPATETGKIAVTVTDKDGKPVEGATVRVTAPKAAAAKTSDKSAPQAAGDAKPAGGKTPPVAEGKTDKDGKATLENIPAGDYNVSANLKGTGSARQKVTVKAGDTLSVDLKLAPRASKNG